MIYVIGLALLAFAWVLPGHYFPWAAFQQDNLSAVAMSLAALAVVVTVRAWPVRTPLLALTALLLAIVPWVQWMFGLVPFVSDALLSSAYLVGFALAIVTGLQLGRQSQRFVPALFATCCIGALLSTGLGLAQWQGLGPYDFLEQLGRGDRVFANLTQPNQLASLIGLGLAGILWAYESRRIGGFGTCAATAFLGWGMVMTQSRVGWAYAIVVVALWAMYRTRLSLRTPVLGIVLAIAAFAACVLAWGPLNVWLQLGLDTLSVADRIQPGYRLLHWQALWDALLRSPWFGYGWQQIPSAQLRVVFDHPVTFEQLASSHNQLLDLLLWNGLPIGLLAIGVLFWWGASRLRRCADVDSWALFAALGVLAIHSMVEFPLQYAYFLLPAGLMVGVIEARLPEFEGRSGPPIGRVTYGLAALAMAGLLVMVAREYFEVEEQVRRVRLRELGVVEQPGFHAELPQVVLLDAPREYVRMWLSDQHEGMSEHELQWLRMVSERYPTPPALIRYANALALNGHPAEAARQLNILCRVHRPRNCDLSRVRWSKLAEQQPKLAAVEFPATPSR